VDGAVLLDDIASTIREYVVLTPEQRDAITLYAVHTHAHDAHDFSPILNVKSAQKRSGKSRLMQVLDRILALPLLVSGIRPAALLRIIDLKGPTLLFDEVDAAMKQDREVNEAYRGIINSAFSRPGARCILNVPLSGGGYEPRQFSTWAPLVLSGIGDLPDTVRDRSIEIDMVRKRRDEQVQRLRRRDGKELDVLAQKVARWVRDNFARLQVSQPEIPQALNDRAADAWEPLFAIAELAGGDWPARARQAAVSLSGAQEKDDDSLGTQLLADIREVFTDEQIASQALVERLVALEGRPWSEFGKSLKPITQNRLARLLKPYKIRPGTIRFGSGPDETAKGYRLAHFVDVFARYLPDAGNETVTPSQEPKTRHFRTDEIVTARCDVTDGESEKSPVSKPCDGVTDGNPSFAQDAYSDLAPKEETAI
jgi:putative DNA primase/helicase